MSILQQYLMGMAGPMGRGKNPVPVREEMPLNAMDPVQIPGYGLNPFIGGGHDQRGFPDGPRMRYMTEGGGTWDGRARGSFGQPGATMMGAYDNPMFRYMGGRR